jgi:hypothetical protein
MILLVAGIYLSPQIMAYALAVLIKRAWRLILKALVRAGIVAKRSPSCSPATGKQEV